jgi:general secretion pathway protein A
MQPSTPDTCKEFYGFRNMPFSMTIDSDQNSIYLSQNYETALAILVSSLDGNMALILVTGDEGVGKTTLVSYVLKHIQQDFIVGMVSGHIESTQELLKQTLASFGHIPQKNSTDKMLQQLQHILSAKFENQYGQPSLLIIDDADNMSLDALKGIELLLELNTKSRQLLQLILVGKPELERLLNMPKLHVLPETVRTLCSVKALTTEETQHYIQHRLNLVGVVDNTLFDEQVCSEIFKYSKGIPRKINLICDDALLHSCSMQTHRVSTALISEAANDTKHEGLAKQKQNQYSLDSPVSPNTGGSRKLYPSVLATGLIFTGSILVFYFLPDGLFSPSENQSIEISHNVNKHLGGNNNDNIKAPPPQKTERLEKLAKQEAVPKNEKTQNLLATAEQHLQALRLSTPDGENALEIYRDILEKEPNNEIALKGIKRIAQKYVELADRKSRQGATSKAKKYLEQASTLFPESDTIQKALDQTKKTQAPSKMAKMASQHAPDTGKKAGSVAADKTVTKLFLTAEQQFSDLKLLFPKNDNAYKTYTEILSLLPNNKRAHTGLQRIANHYLVQAKKQRAKGKFEKSQLLITRGLKVLPQHKKLSALKKQVNAELKRNQEAMFAAFEIKKTADNQLENLLNQADHQRHAQQLTQPPGNNALESYNKALQIDPNNEKAQKGLVSIVKQYQTIVGAALADDNTDRALATANEGLAAFPNNQELLILRDNVVLLQETTLKRDKAEVSVKKKPNENDRGLRSFSTF